MFCLVRSIRVHIVHHHNEIWVFEVMLNGLMVIKEIRKNNSYNFKVKTIIKSKAIIAKDDGKTRNYKTMAYAFGTYKLKDFKKLGDAKVSEGYKNVQTKILYVL